MDANLERLNAQFAVPEHVSFHAGPGELAMAVINNAYAAAAMTLAGGHIMTFIPHGQKPLLWVSPNASFTLGRAMRGGVPICWPWFGPHPSEPKEKPSHGFARTHLFTVAGTRALPGGETEIRMILSDSAETRALWQHPFSLEVTAVFGSTLSVTLAARNPGSKPYTFTGALHPYFAVSNAADVTVTGLNGVDYLDKNQDFRRFTQQETIHFGLPVDRVYVDTAADLVIHDPGFFREIHITKTGSRTTVVWNPALQDAQLPDVGAGNHVGFVCVESANAIEEIIEVPPGGEAYLGMLISVVPADREAAG